MPAYNFMPDFVPAIESGQKTHTMRRPRKRPTKVGDRLLLFTGMRRAGCRLILDTVCKSVLPVTVTEDYLQIAHRKLSVTDTRHFARADGFRDYAGMLAFFRKQYGLPVKLECISWRFPPPAI